MPRSPEIPAVPAVLCHKVVKRFYRYEHRVTSLREIFVRALRRKPMDVRRAEFTLREFDMRVEAGESLAIVGRNASGKSTALRLIAASTRRPRGSSALEGAWRR